MAGSAFSSRQRFSALQDTALDFKQKGSASSTNGGSEMACFGLR